MCLLNCKVSVEVITRPFNMQRGTAVLISINRVNNGSATSADPNPVTPCVNPARKNIRKTYKYADMERNKVTAQALMVPLPFRPMGEMTSHQDFSQDYQA